MTPKTKRYDVEVTEILSTIVEVMASTEEDAIEKVKKAYRQEQIVLSEQHYLQTEFELNTDKDSSNR